MEGILVHQEGRVAIVNSALARMLGYEPEELVGREVFDLLPPQYHREAAERIRSRTEEPWDLEGLRKDGSRFPARLTARNIVYRGRPARVVAVRDLSREREAREAVRRREAILEAVATAAQQFLAASSWQDVVAEVLAGLGQAGAVSRAYLFENRILPDGRLARYERHEWVAPGVDSVIGRPEHQGVPYGDADLAAILRRLGHREVVQVVAGRLPEASRAHLAREGVRAALMVPVFVGDEWWGYLGFDDCVAERVWSAAEVEALRAAAGILGAAIRRERAEADRQDAEERYRRLVERIPAVVYEAEFGEEGRWHYVSPQIEPLLGFGVEEWLADPGLWLRRVHPDDRPRVLADERLAAAGGALSSEYRLLARDGREVWVRDEAEVVRDGAGRPVLLRGLMYDVTVMRQVQEQLRESEATVRRLLDRLVRAQEEERARVAQDIHDDSIQIMTAAALRIEAARRRLGPGEEARVLERLEGTVNEAIRRLRRLLFELRPRALDQEGLAAALRLYLDRLGEETGMGWAVDNRLVEEPSPEVRTVLYRIAQEALTNVRKHARASRVEVLVEQRDGGLLLRVRDDGAGFRVGETTDAPHGHLGLTSMRERAEMAGGWLRVDSTPGLGTVVEAWVPEAPPDTGGAQA